VKTPDLEVDAERLYALSQAYRTAKKEAEMLRVEHADEKLSREQMVRRGLMRQELPLGGTRSHQAAINYQRVLDSFPNGKNAFNCEWRLPGSRI